MEDITVKKIKYICEYCKKEEIVEYRLSDIPEVTRKCPYCQHFTMKQEKYNYFRDGPRS